MVLIKSVTFKKTILNAIDRHFFLTCGRKGHSFMLKWFVKSIWGPGLFLGISDRLYLKNFEQCFDSRVF